MGPAVRRRGQATYFDAVNRNKRSVVLDLARPRRSGTGARLALSADVLVENFRPGLMDGLGLGYEALRVEKPGARLLLDHGLRQRWRAARRCPATTCWCRRSAV